MPTLQISTQSAHRPASPKEKGQERGGNGTPAMAPAPNEEVTVLVCSGPWKRDKTQSKNRSANTCAVEESSSCLRMTPTEGSRSLMPHPAGHRNLACGGAPLQKCTKNVASGEEIPTAAHRILPPAASLEAWLHRARVLASFLWWGVLYRAWAGHGQKILTRRDRISGLAASSGGLAAQSARPGFFPVVRGALQGMSRARAKNPNAAR